MDDRQSPHSFLGSPKEGDRVKWDMGNKSLDRQAADYYDWHEGEFRFKKWEDDHGDNEFAWNCYIQEDGAESYSQVYLQEIPWTFL